MAERRDEGKIACLCLCSVSSANNPVGEPFQLRDKRAKQALLLQRSSPLRRFHSRSSCDGTWGQKADRVGNP